VAENLMLEEQRFKAMGCSCRVVTRGSDGAALEGVRLVREYEARWSRFISSSEICGINALAGQVVVTSPETFNLIALAEAARSWTKGRFNPLMLSQLEASGYSRRWSEGVSDGYAGGATPGTNLAIDLFASANAVVLPKGHRFDPGGIGKGFAADLVCAELVRLGATTVMVDLGGDLRVAGDPWYGDQWRVELAAPQQRRDSAGCLTLAEDGAVATSSVLSRRWRSGGQAVHHLLDPLTGLSCETDLLTVSVCAPTTWQAEVAAKVGLLAGSVGVAAELRRLGVHGVAFTRDGSPISTRRSAMVS